MTWSMLDEHVASVRVADPSGLETFRAQDLTQLRDDLMGAADDDRVKSIVLTGLAAGTTALAAPRTDSAPTALAFGTRGPFQIAAYCKKVLIAVVDGRCGPAASSLCLAADLALATPTSTFASPFAVPQGNYVLGVLTMRANRTKTWMLTGASMSARDVLDIGFLNEVIELPHLEDAALTWARRAARTPLDGITVSKMNINAAQDVAGVGRDFDAAEAFAAIGAGFDD